MEQVFFNVPLAKLKPIFKEWVKEAQTELQTNEDFSNKKYSIKGASEKLDVTPLTMRNYIKNGKVKAERLGRKYYIPHSELFDALNEVKSLKYKR